MSITEEPIDFGRASSGNYVQLLDAYFEKPLVLSPEKALLLAMFEGAIHDVDLNWINRRDQDSVIGFDYTCETLGLNPEATRAALNKQLNGKKPPKRSSGTHGCAKKPIIVDDLMKEGYSHQYQFQTHCDDCESRYQRAYRKARKVA